MAPETFNPFQPAVKSQIKARVAIDGPTGSGKTWTALKWATVLAGPDGDQRRDNGLARISLIDTERRSASLYAPHFTFDVANFGTPYDVTKLIATLRAAEAAGYDVAVLDSWSHFWEGEGGVLDEVDGARRRSNGDPTGWQYGTPLQRNMVDVILDLDMHVIVTMRSKMEYVIEEYDDNGRKRARVEKLGLKPVQRAGVEYEFQVVGDMDLDHRITISKSRCDVLADKVIQPHRESEAAETFLKWLDDGEPPPPLATEADLRAHVAAVKAGPPEVMAAMKAWVEERGLKLEGLTEPELEDANDHLADLLIEQAEIAGDTGEPGPTSGDDSTPETASGDDAEHGPSGSAVDAVADSPVPGEREPGEREQVAQAQLAAVKSA